MYKVVLIDDEPWTIIDLKETLHWEQFSMQVAADFENPQDALQYIRHAMPDVVFTDIRMPNISGLEIIQKIKEFHPNCICVIVSGFAEFELAQQAISVGACEYCLKPLDEEKGNLVLQKIKAKLDSCSSVHEESESGEKELNAHLQKILDYIERNLHKKITAQDVADYCHITKAYCCRLLARHLNMTFSQYLLEKRMEYAARLLKDPGMNMAEIAQWVGYPDYFYFSKSFKKYYGMSPTSYQTKLLNGELSEKESEKNKDR